MHPEESGDYPPPVVVEVESDPPPLSSAIIAGASGSVVARPKARIMLNALQEIKSRRKEYSRKVLPDCVDRWRASITWELVIPKTSKEQPDSRIEPVHISTLRAAMLPTVLARYYMYLRLRQALADVALD